MCEYYIEGMYKRMEKRKTMQEIIGERKKVLIEESEKFAQGIYDFLAQKAQESLDPEGEMNGISVFFDDDTVMILPSNSREEWEFYIEFPPSAVTRRVIMLMLDEVGYDVDLSRIPLKWETGFVGKYFLRK